MIIAEATSETIALPTRERSRFSFRLQARRIDKVETHEPFIVSSELSESDFLIEPFWLTENDIEGDCYAEYIMRHPDFSLIMRRGVYKRLCLAKTKLPRHWQIVLKAGFRPLVVQEAVLQAFIDKSRSEHPDWSTEDNLAQARLFVADPKVVCPPHTTGGAIDIDIKDTRTGLVIDMGCPVNTDSSLAFLHSDQLTTAQYANRMTLLDAMLEAGFAPNVYEWWHYQYGETYWAAFFGQAETLYDIVATDDIINL